MAIYYISYQIYNGVSRLCEKLHSTAGNSNRNYAISKSRRSMSWCAGAESESVVSFRPRL